VERLTYIERSVRAHQLLGQHQLAPRHRLDWNLNASSVARSEPDRSEFVTWLDPSVPIWFKDYEGAVRTFGSIDETGLEGGVTYGWDVGADPVQPARIRFGATGRRTSRDADSRGFRIQPFYWTPTDERWQAPPEEFFDGRYTSQGDDVLILAPELSGGSYRARDWLGAGFLMVELSATDRIRVITGARVESYHLDLDSENQLGQTFGTKKDDTDVLPSVIANLALRQNHQLRISAARTLARPEYREIAPIIYRQVLGGEQVIGDTGLERTLIDNLDIRWEWYPNPGEVVSLGLFGKRFDAPIEQRYLGHSGTDLLSFRNAESATNFGVELDVSRRMDWIADALRHWSVFGNLTLMRSRVETGIGGDPERAMVGQAPWVVNSGLSYSGRPGVVATLLYNVVGPRIANARPAGRDVDDVIERPRHLLDLSLRFPMGGAASGKVDLTNLLDAPYELAQGPIIRERHRSGRSFSVGLSWRW
jgi:outer membrane receptor protein involved in Fe transport